MIPIIRHVTQARTLIGRYRNFVSPIGPCACHDGVTWPSALYSQSDGIVKNIKFPELVGGYAW